MLWLNRGRLGGINKERVGQAYVGKLIGIGDFCLAPLLPQRIDYESVVRFAGLNIQQLVQRQGSN
jgi:hypothetical protein